MRSKYLVLGLVLTFFWGAASGFNFFESSQKWPDATTAFHVDIPGADGLWNSSFETAMFLWNSSTVFNYTIFRESFWDPCSNPNSNQRRNGVKFNDTVCGDAFGANTLAVARTWSIASTSTIIQSGIIFNTSFEWDVYSGPIRSQTIDFQRVAVHELGHALGLGHEVSAPAIMAPSVDNITEPQPDDINGVNTLYGGPGPTCTTPSTPSLSAPSSASSGQTYTVSCTFTSPDNRYEIQESTSSSFSGAQTFTVTGTTSKSFSHSSGTYYYRVRAVDNCNGQDFLSGWSNTHSILIGPTCTAPSTPFLSAPSSAGSGQTYIVSWTSTSPDNRYEIQESTSSSFSGAQTFTVTGTSKSFNHSSGRYYYRVRAVDNCNGQDFLSSWSNSRSLLIEEAPCVFTLSKLSGNYPSTGRNDNISVTASSDCNWVFQSNDDWITITSSGGRIGNGSVSFSVESNYNILSRTGTLTIANRIVTVNQDESPFCGAPLAPLLSGPLSVGNNVPYRVDFTFFSPETRYEIQESGQPSFLNRPIDSPRVPFKSYRHNVTGPRRFYYRVRRLENCDELSAVSDWFNTHVVIVSPQDCVFTVSPEIRFHGPDASSGNSVDVVAPSVDSNCTWRAESNASWLRISSGHSGTGNGTVSYVIHESTTSGDRTGTLSIAGQNFTVTQSDTTICNFNLSKPGSSFSSSAASGSVLVTASANSCSWSATSSESWITITAGSNRRGNRTLVYSVQANPSNSRTGTLTIAEQPFTVTQEGSCEFSLPTSGISLGLSAASSSVSVTASSSTCSWSATSNVSWISITAGSSGTGSGTVSFSVQANLSGNSRTGTLTIAEQPFTVTQEDSSTLLQVGYAVLTQTAVNRIPIGTALFSATNAQGTLAWEAGLAAVDPLSSGRIFVDQQGDSLTALALVNPSPQTVIVTLILRDAAGNEVDRQDQAFTGGQHQALFVNQLFSGLENFTGSLSFQTSASEEKLAAVTLRQSTNLNQEAIFSTLPVVDLTAAATTESIIFPQVGAGVGLSTQIVLINPSEGSVSGQIQLFGDDGNALQLELDGTAGSAFPYQIEGNGTFQGKLRSNSAPQVGYAMVTLEEGEQAPSGTAIFQIKSGETLISEAGMAVVTPTTSARIFVDNMGTQTGVALANPGNPATTVSFNLLNLNGSSLETTTRDLAAGGHLSIFTDQLFSEAGEGFTGLMEITSSVPIAPVTLKLTTNERDQSILTTLPLVDLTQPLTADSLIFPQIGLGNFGAGAFATRLILINQETSSEAIGNLELFQSDGSPLVVRIGQETNSAFTYQIPAGGGDDFRPNGPTVAEP